MRRINDKIVLGNNNTWIPCGSKTTLCKLYKELDNIYWTILGPTTPDKYNILHSTYMNITTSLHINILLWCQWYPSINQCVLLDCKCFNWGKEREVEDLHLFTVKMPPVIFRSKRAGDYTSLSANSDFASLKPRLLSLQADTKRPLLWTELSHWDSRKKLFHWAVFVEPTGMKQIENCGFNWHFRAGIKASMPVYNEEETSMAQYSMGKL